MIIRILFLFFRVILPFTFLIFILLALSCFLLIRILLLIYHLKLILVFLRLDWLYRSRIIKWFFYFCFTMCVILFRLIFISSSCFAYMFSHQKLSPISLKSLYFWECKYDRNFVFYWSIFLSQRSNFNLQLKLLKVTIF